MKREPRYGSCKRKHSVGVLSKNMRDYFTAEGVALSEVDGFILERFSSLKAEPQEACEWASCKEVEL
jgi:hypothetical protein